MVDGQQRLATLASTLLVAPSPGERALYFDLDRKRFLWTREAAATLLKAGVSQVDLWVLARTAAD